MNIVSFILDIIAVSIVSFLFLSRYINIRRNAIVVLVVTYIAWYFSFLILFVLPLDVSNTYYLQCLNQSTIDVSHHTTTTVAPNTTQNGTQLLNSNATTVPTPNGNTTIGSTTLAPISYCSEPLIGAPEDVLNVLWLVVYWSSQVLTWLLLPIMQSYATAGEFTVLGKIKNAIVSNALYYGSYLLLAGVFLIVLVAKGVTIDGPSLYSICVTASNTWGLFCLVFLLGYGLVEVPRVCWRRGDVRTLLREAYFKIAKLSLEKSDAEDNLTEIADIIRRMSATVSASRSNLVPYITIMINKLPESISSRMNRRGATSTNRGRDDSASSDVDLLGDVTLKSLAKLHKKLISGLHRYSMAQARWSAAVSRSMCYEDTVNSIATTGFFHRTTGAYMGFFKLICTPSVEWYWRCLIQPWGFRLLACVLAILSLFVVWSEVVFWCQSPVLSLYAIFMDEAQRNHAFVVLELLTAFTVAYLSICAYYTIFKVRILSYYHLSPHHNTDENSLIFSGMLLCRFTPALCLNYLSLIHLEKSVNPNMTVETAYSKVMGRMQLLPFISSGFNIYFPIAILLICFATIFSLASRILHAIGFQQFIGDDDMTNELVEEGKQLISRERGYLDRAARRDDRRKELEQLGVYPRNGEGGGAAGQLTASSSNTDISARQRRNYMQPDSINNDNFLSVGSSAGADQFIGSYSGSANDRSQLLSGPTDPPVYTHGGAFSAGQSLDSGSNRLGRPVPPTTGQQIPSSRNLFDDI